MTPSSGVARGLGSPRHADVVSLARSPRGPFVSMYLPLAAEFSGRIDDALNYGLGVVHAVDRLESEGLDAEEVPKWAQQLADFSSELRNVERLPLGVAVFLDESGRRAYRLPVPPREHIYVADCFALRELIRQLDLGATESRVMPPRSGVVGELDRILQASRRDRIRTLWTREGAVIPGRFDAQVGRLISAHGRDGDVLEVLSTRVLASGGHVHVVPDSEMPAPVSVVAEL